MRYEMMFADHPKARIFLDRNFPNHDIIEVEASGELPAGECYSNVRRTVSLRGGSSAFGFVSLIIPGVLIEALHHAVWRSPEGTLIDVTSAPYGNMRRIGKTAFIPQDAEHHSEYDPIIPPVFHAFQNIPIVQEYISIRQMRMEALAKLHEQVAMNGIKPRDDGNIAIGNDLPEELYAAHAEFETVEQRQSLIIPRFLEWLSKY